MNIAKTKNIYLSIVIFAFILIGSVILSDECNAQTILDSTNVIPSTVNVSSGMQTVVIDLWMRNATDSIIMAIVYIGDPDTSSMLGFAALKSGNKKNGVWESSIIVWQNTPVGDYPVTIQAYDAMFNMVQLNTGKVVKVIGGDSNPPALAGDATVTPSHLDLNNGSQTDTVLIPLQDDLSGLYYVTAKFRNSSGNTVASEYAMKISGDTLNGMWKSIVTIPQKANSPLYLYVEAIDRAFNTAELNTGKTITVSGNDTMPPIYISPATISPGVVNVSSGAKDVNVGVMMQDDRTGVSSVGVEFLDSASNYVAGETALRISGDSLNGQWQAVVSIPQETPAGILTLRIYSNDNANNYTDTITTQTIQVLREPESIVTFRVDLRRLYRLGLITNTYTHSPVVEIFTGTNGGIYNLEDPDDDSIWTISKALNIDQTISFAYALNNYGDKIYELNGALGGRSLVIPSADPIILPIVTFDNLPIDNIETDWAARVSQSFYPGNPYIYHFDLDTVKTYVTIDYLTLDKLSLTSVRRFAKSPGGSLPGGIVTMASNIYWSISTIPGSANFSAKIIFEYNLFGGITNPSALRLLKRESRLHPWVVVPSEVSLDDKTISALVENSFSDWTFGSVSSENTLIPQTPGIASNPFPVNGATEINTNVELSWTPPSAARTFDIYLWKSTDPAPSTPTASNISVPRFKSSSSLEYGTVYNWYVVTKNLAGNSTSPTWSFTTLNVADLHITQVVVPPVSYSGKSIEVKWTVENQGVSGTNPSAWYDRIYLSQDSTFNIREDLFLGNFQNMNHLNPGESYVNTASLDLPNGVFGPYYLFVRTDEYHLVPESNDTNNVFIKSFTITLTQPPDLQIISSISPDLAFSGQTIDVTYQVKNTGSNSTDVSRWYDGLYLSQDSILNIKTDERLAVLTHDGILLSDSSYSGLLTGELPDGISGTYYLFVYTDYSNRVYEYTMDDNNTRRSTIEITLTPPPDLVVTSVLASSTGNSGGKISVQWSVQNQGLSQTERSWNDRIFLSKIYPFILDSSVVLGDFGNYSGLQIDSGYTQNKSVTLPNGISGTYHIYVETDWKKKIFESTFEDNNISTIDVPISIDLSPWPDLIVSSIQKIDSATVSDVLSIQWTVNNQGAGSIVASPCADSLFLSTSAIWNRDIAIPIGNLAQTIDLPSSGNLSKTVQVKVPSYIPANKYYLYIQADARNTIYEHTDEWNNISRTDSIKIKSLPQPDLNLSSLIGGDSAFSGKPYSVSFEVQNIGSGITPTSHWADLIYLSADTVFDYYDDINIARVDRWEPLAAGSSYSRNLTVTIPNGLYGKYYLIVKCDSVNEVNDSNLLNNIKYKASTITVTLSPSPDLRVTSFMTPANWNAGQPAKIIWTVENSGYAMEPGVKWYDAIYISSYSTLNSSAIQLGFVEHKTPIGASEYYSDTLETEIPSTLSGSYYIIIQADSRKDIYEHGAENNNTQVNPIIVTLPPPADLIVTNVEVPVSGVAGEDLTINWIIKNQGTNQATGRMSESVYLSSDSIWNYDDPLLGVIVREIDLAPGISAMMTMKGDLSNLSISDSLGEIIEQVPGLLTGDYYAIIRTNIKHNIRESDFTNNSKTSDGKINIDVPLLPLNVLVADTLGGSEKKYFKVITPSNIDLRITSTTNVGYPIFDAYVSYGKVPAPSNYDYKSAERVDLSKEVFVPSTQSGTYYVLLRSNSASISQEYSIIAETLSFSISSITPARGGRGGYVTSILQGAGFRDSTRLFLYKSGEQVAEGQVRKLNSSMEMVLRWDLRNVPLGTYDIVAKNSNGATTNRPDAFTVEPARELTVSVGKNIPKLLLYGRKEPFSFQFTNTSNIDIPYFFAVLAVPPNTEVELTTDNRLIKRSNQVPDSLIESGKKIADYTESATGRFLPLIVRDLAPGEVVNCRLVVRNMSLFAGSNLPLFLGTRAMDKSVFLNTQLLSIEDLRTNTLQNPSLVAPELLAKAYDSKEFARYILSGYLKLGLIDAEDTTAIVTNFASDQMGLQLPSQNNLSYANAIQSSLELVKSPTGMCEDFFFVLGCAAAIGDCFIELPIPTGVSQALCVIGVAGCFGIDTGLLGCAGVLSALVCIGKEYICNNIVASLDPNDMIGPDGYGDKRWVAKTQTLPYKIRFENDAAKASAPAQRVTISQQFDSSVDIRAFRLGSFGFANHSFDILGQTSFYSNRLDLRDSLGIYVDVTAGIDVTTRKAFWTFKSIDPVTGEQPSNPMVGLLPINDSTGKGGGFVNYAIRPATTSVTGDSIHATARIIFDVNDPLDTEPIFNVVDAQSPQSNVRPLPATTNNTSFAVTWGGSDDSAGSGLKNFSIYVSRNDSSYIAWRVSTTDTMAVFYGNAGSSYKFISLATDNAGNIEPTKFSPDASIQIITDVIENKAEIPKSFALRQNYPNPFNPSTVIRFEVPVDADVELQIYNVLGQVVKTLVNERRTAGIYDIHIGTSSLSSGVYFYRMTAKGTDKSFVDVKKMALIR